ncbi:MAG: NEW3 domain-containing protein [Chitinophagaceae bacterium]
MLTKKTHRTHSFRQQGLLLVFLVSCLLGAPPFQKTNAQKPKAAPAQKDGLSAQLFNLEVATGSTFNYYATLHNSAPNAKNYQLSAELPEGWQVTFKVNSSQVSSINVDAGQTQNISVDIAPALSAKPQKFNVPVYAVADNDTSKLDLEAVVKGTYGIQLTTPTGKLSDDVTEGSNKTITLQVKNTGTIPLNGIDLRGQTPPNWQITFDSAKVLHLEPNETHQIIATIAVPDKTLSGDYQATLSAKTLNNSSEITFRFTVKASLLTGWLGILIILAAIGIVYFLVRKYGRR